MKIDVKTRVQKIREWARADPQRAARIIAMTPVTLFAFTVAAAHTLETGRERADITGWQAWSVAGALEVLAAYAFFLFLRNRGWRRTFPFLVFVGDVFLILWINLATVADYSWTAIKEDPFPAIYAVLPAAVFVVGVVLMEVDAWKPSPKRSPARQGGNSGKADPKPTKQKTGQEKDAQTLPPPGLDDLTLERGRRAVEALRARDVKITGDTLRMEMGVRKDKALEIGEALGVITRKRKETA